MALTHYRNTVTGQVYGADERSIPTAATLESRVREDGKPEYEKVDNPTGQAAAESDGTQDGEAYNPTEHTVDEVNTYLGKAAADERERVLQAEADGKARQGILNGPHSDKSEEAS